MKSLAPRVGSSLPLSRRVTSWRDRLGVTSRFLAAALGGYALTALVSLHLARLSTAPREEAIARATTPVFLLLIGAFVWAFAARSALRAWAGIGLPALVLAVIEIWIRKQSSS